MVDVVTRDDIIVRKNGRVHARRDLFGNVIAGARIGCVRNCDGMWRPTCLRGACSWSGAVWLTRIGAVESLLRHWEASDRG